jgi:predicted NBD/HSP70 family sugar kinase
MQTPASWVVVGLDTGGNTNNATVLDATGQFLVDRMVETPSRVVEGPAVAVRALVEAYDGILSQTNTPLSLVRAIGLDTPGPASADARHSRCCRKVAERDSRWSHRESGPATAPVWRGAV